MQINESPRFYIGTRDCVVRISEDGNISSPISSNNISLIWCGLIQEDLVNKVGKLLTEDVYEDTREGALQKFKSRVMKDYQVGSDVICGSIRESNNMRRELLFSSDVGSIMSVQRDPLVGKNFMEELGQCIQKLDYPSPQPDLQLLIGLKGLDLLKSARRDDVGSSFIAVITTPLKGMTVPEAITYLNEQKFCYCNSIREIVFSEDLKDPLAVKPIAPVRST